MRVLKACAIAAAIFAAPVANAAILDAPVADNAYISVNGMDWAWAAPCAALQPSCGVVDLSYQSQFGWRLPTLEEFRAAGISAMDFLFAGANVPQGGSGPNGASFSGAGAPSDGACAAIYFSSVHSHCDWVNGADDLWDPISDLNYAEALVVRGSPANIPVPAGLPLVLTGLGALAWMRRKNKRA